jgi:enoyl-CoA hydratase
MTTTRAGDLELDTLSVEQKDRVLTVRFSDPPHNFMTARMQKDLDTLTAAVDGDASVGAVVLTGGVPKRYITHFDIAEILASAQRVGRPLSDRALLNLMRGFNIVGALPGGEQALERSPVNRFLSVTRFNQVVLRIMRSPAVYLAAIGGPCGGAGLEMSVCFDVRLAADDESVGFILPELLIGLTTTVGGQRLAQLIGPARALEMMLEGRMYTPQEAHQMGLVNRLVPPDDLINKAQELGALYASRNRDTIAAQKKVFNENLVLNPAESLRRESAANVSTILSGPAPQALQKWLDMQRAVNGESVFLTDLEAWIDGEVVQLNARAGHARSSASAVFTPLGSTGISASSNPI